MRHDLQANTCLGTCDYFLCLEMTSDVEIQFQNRRNRTRKVGQEFKRKPRNEALKLPLDAMIAKMPYSIIPKNQRKPYVEDGESEYEWQYESDEEDVVSTVPPTRFCSFNFFCSRNGEKGIHAIPMQRTSSIFLQHHMLSLFRTHHTTCFSLKVGNHRFPLHNGNDRQPSHPLSDIHLLILWL